jgi:hypothetical protein
LLAISDRRTRLSSAPGSMSTLKTFGVARVLVASRGTRAIAWKDSCPASGKDLFVNAFRVRKITPVGGARCIAVHVFTCRTPLRKSTSSVGKMLGLGVVSGCVELHVCFALRVTRAEGCSSMTFTS